MPKSSLAAYTKPLALAMYFFTTSSGCQPMILILDLAILRILFISGPVPITTKGRCSSLNALTIKDTCL